ncbi:hypothetical protein CB0940_01219 [Cercospora beticola]|uniref:Pectin lyase fold/virulence factor n=1 Tax=Cercospora beticola TaxID=122368 RepID=A0A2G5I7Q3_CERBT|nr:hypothetical protein CB0940_01219 [Cercospora beticola]PIB00762.1 hypothetical protein CB0940_01219 [Cercospora beticola]WPA96650.1 hypothetical protein RHO25_001258 [Cercospora beticola]
MWTSGTLSTLLLTCAFSKLSAADFWVSPNGNDANDGSEASPFATLDAARQSVRRVNSSLQSDLFVNVLPGTYYLDKPLTFEAADSGSNGRRVVWRATGDGVNISGGTAVTAWSVHDAGKNIWKASVPQGSRSRHLYVNQKHATRARQQLARSDLRLTSNGFAIANPDRQYLARLPGIEKGELRSRASFTDRYIPIESVNGNDLIMANPAFKNNIIGFDTFTVPAHEGALWLANVLDLLDETNEYFLDEDASVVYYKPDAADMSNQNVVPPRLEYLLALAGTYDAPVHDLTFQGFNYMHTTWNQPSTNLGYVDQQTGGYIGRNKVYDVFESSRPFWYQVPGSIQASAVKDVSFRGGSLTAIMGGFGIGNDANAHASQVGLGASNVDITGMLFKQTGANAITVGGIQADAHHPSDPRMTVQDITITENIFTDVAYTFQSCVPIFVTYLTGAKITYNDIYDVPYSGICYGYGWGANDQGGSDEYEKRGLYQYQPRYDTPTTLKDGLISNNLIQRFGTVMTDLGAFYTLAKSPATSVRNNCVAQSVGFAAVCTDEGSRDYVVKDSTFLTGGFWLNRNERPGYTTGNLTFTNLAVQADPQNGSNQWGDTVSNVIQVDDQNSLPDEFKGYCINAGIPQAQRGSRPAHRGPFQ